METAVKVPLGERVNLRMLVFIAVIGFLVGYPIYILIDAQMSGGVKNAANGYKLVDLKAMSSFELDQTNGTINDIPSKWRDLEGQKVINHNGLFSLRKDFTSREGDDLSTMKYLWFDPDEMERNRDQYTRESERILTAN